MADIKCLEHPTLKVPYELLNKKFRGGQKTIDREVSHVVSSANEVEKVLVQPGVTAQQVSAVITGLTEKLTQLKRKAEESLQDEIVAGKACKRRIEHLKESENSTAVACQTQWKKKRLDRMLVEYFLRAGYYDTAIQLAQHSHIQELTNIDLFLVSKKVEDSLAQHETAECLNWCHDNKSKMRKLKSTLEFKLRQQEYIELIRQNKRMDAVKHARKYLTNTNIVDDTLMEDVERVMGLLAFPTDTQLSPYKELLSENRWQQLIEQFRQENFKLYQLNPHSVFSVVLQAGMSALKTPQCYKEDPASKNPNCPICSSHINKLAKNLPFAHCANSRLICRISGQQMNEHNPPMMLPNGYVYGYNISNPPMMLSNGHVYGYNSLVQMAAENDGKVVCPPRSRLTLTSSTKCLSCRLPTLPLPSR